MAKSFELVFGNSLAPNRIFNAILRLLFSAAAELAQLQDKSIACGGES